MMTRSWTLQQGCQKNPDADEIYQEEVLDAEGRYDSNEEVSSHLPGWRRWEKTLHSGCSAERYLSASDVTWCKTQLYSTLTWC